MSYVDGFVLPLHTSKIDQYTEMATKAVWLRHGALEYREAVAVGVGGMT